MEQGIHWGPQEVRQVTGGDGAFAFVSTSEQSYPPGRVSELGPARSCWIYAHVASRITAVGVYGPQRELTADECEELAVVAAGRLEQAADAGANTGGSAETE